MKREDYINWDEYFMGVALLTAQLDALLTDCGDVTRALAGSTVTRSALRRGGSDSRTLYQLLNRSTVALREYADFEVYGEDGDWSWAVIIGGTDEASQVIALACPKNRFNGGVNLSSFGGNAADYIAYTSLF